MGEKKDKIQLLLIYQDANIDSPQRKREKFGFGRELGQELLRPRKTKRVSKKKSTCGRKMVPMW